MAIPGILEVSSLYRLYEKFGGAVANPFAPYFTTVGNKPGDKKVALEVYQYGRGVAGMNVRGGTPQVVAKPTRTVVIYAAVTVSEAIVIEPDTIKDLRAPGSEQVGTAEAEVARQIKQLRFRIDRLKALLMAQAVKGTLSFTLPGGVAETVSMGMSATHTPSVVPANWATVATSIMDYIDTIKDTVAQDAGKTITTMWMNTTTAQYLRKNTEIKALWTGLPEAVQVLRTGGLPPICGVTPVVTDVGYKADGGSYTKLLANNQVVFGPSPVESEALLTECEPLCLDAPAGMRGIYFKPIFPGPQSHINEGITVENEYTFLPNLGAEPDAWWYLADVTAT